MAASMNMSAFWGDAACSRVNSPMFQESLLPPSSGQLIALLTEAVSSSETSVNVYAATQRITPEDNHPESL
jgi:hypothetical protein